MSQNCLRQQLSAINFIPWDQKVNGLIKKFGAHNDGLVQYCSISIANAIKILQSCTIPSISDLIEYVGMTKPHSLKQKCHFEKNSVTGWTGSVIFMVQPVMKISSKGWPSFSFFIFIIGCFSVAAALKLHQVLPKPVIMQHDYIIAFFHEGSIVCPLSSCYLFPEPSVYSSKSNKSCSFHLRERNVFIGICLGV